MQDYSCAEIAFDYKAIAECLSSCLFNNVGAAIYAAVVPYLCVFVYAGQEYFDNKKAKYNFENKPLKTKVGKARSIFLKQYAELDQQNTYWCLNDFNKSEYNKFLRKEFPNLRPNQAGRFNNYYIACINDKPVDNYHLSSLSLGCEIGSYVDDIQPQIQTFIYQMVSFIGNVITAAHLKIEPNTTKITFDEAVYYDINMAYNYVNFGIQNNPPVLMAFMDILCSVNAYNEILTKFNLEKVLDLKIKYLTLFCGIVGTKNLINHCRANNIHLEIDCEFEKFISNINRKYCTSKLRKYCAHYDYQDMCWESDPVVEAFEAQFKLPIAEVSQVLSDLLLTLSNYLNDFVIKKPFPKIQQ